MMPGKVAGTFFASGALKFLKLNNQHFLLLSVFFRLNEKFDLCLIRVCAELPFVFDRLVGLLFDSPQAKTGGQSRVDSKEMRFHT